MFFSSVFSLKIIFGSTLLIFLWWQQLFSPLFKREMWKWRWRLQQCVFKAAVEQENHLKYQQPFHGLIYNHHHHHHWWIDVFSPTFSLVQSNYPPDMYVFWIFSLLFKEKKKKMKRFHNSPSVTHCCYLKAFSRCRSFKCFLEYLYNDNSASQSFSSLDSVAFNYASNSSFLHFHV